MSEAPFIAKFSIVPDSTGQIQQRWEFSRDPNPLEMMIWQLALAVQHSKIVESFRRTEQVIQAAPTNGHVTEVQKPRLVTPEGVATGEPA